MKSAAMFLLMWVVLPVILFAVFALWLLTSPTRARDAGQWDASDPAVSAWYRGLMRPDMPESPCCGEADAYWADSFAVDRASGQYVAIVTDEREDKPLGRPHVPRARASSFPTRR
jgi:hypothetical protein